MSRIIIRDPETGDLGQASDVNATASSWDTHSDNIESENIRTEGLDRRVFAKEFQVFCGNFEGHVDGPHMGPLGVTAAGEFATPVHCGGIGVATGDSIVVHAGFGFYNDSNVAASIRGSIGYKTGSGGVATNLPKTIRWYGWTPFIVSENNVKGCYAACTVPDLPVASNYWFTLMLQITSGGAPAIYIHNPYITAVRRRA